jgi:DNA-binding transcriptional LysR family regulator
MHFDLIDMRLFVNIAEANSLTQGAQHSYMSLPAASMRIKNIEERFGTKLLYRHSQGVSITPAGQAFLHYALLMMQLTEKLNGEMQDYANGVKGHLRISANTNSIEFLPSVLQSYLATHPDVSVDLKERLSKDVVHAVSEGSTDVGIVAGNIHTGGLQVLPYKRDRLVLTTSSRHPLSDRNTIKFIETLDFDYIGLLEGSAIHTFISQAAKDMNKTLKVRIQLSNFEALCRMIEANAGIGVVPESVAQRHQKHMDIRIVALEDDWAVRNLKVCVRDLELLPSFARDLVDLLIVDARC